VITKVLNTHPVRIEQPYFGDGSGAQLHRFLDDEFIPRFQRDLKRFSLSPAWKTEDRFSQHDNVLILRLPLHRTFYVVSCEVVCDRLGSPALDPRRITSAGFVIRRVGGTREQSWMIEDDQPLGWQDTPTGLRDPDVNRRLCLNNVLHPRDPVPTYSGEQTHPLHTQTHYDGNGKRHTVLYGYLPLGGSYTLTLKDLSPFDSASEAKFRADGETHFPWPFGFRPPLDLTWRPEYTRPIDHGRPTKPMFELLRAFVNRFHVGEGHIDENQQLQQFAENIFFFNETSAGATLTPQTFSDQTRSRFDALRQFSLWTYLQSFAGNPNALANWAVQQEQRIDDAGSLDALGSIDLLPGRNGSGTLPFSLYMTPADAQELRALLGQRLVSQALAKAREIPLPKFEQDQDDIYQIVPFLRARDEAGKERIYWADSGARSETFRVAAPFDPDASRPAMIQMPSLADLRKGLAKGVSLITPPDTYAMLSSLNLKKGASADLVGGTPLNIGIQWICSISLPSITLIAMILIMIMISLLNIVFFWMPWVRICLPFPKIKK
jgi:hypothetical protein